MIIPLVPLPSLPKLDLPPIAINASVPSPTILIGLLPSGLKLMEFCVLDNCSEPASNSSLVVLISTPLSKIK